MPYTFCIVISFSDDGNDALHLATDAGKTVASALSEVACGRGEGDCVSHGPSVPTRSPREGTVCSLLWTPVMA